MATTVASTNKRKLSFGEWVKTLTFYELLIGMKATLKHLLRYKPITLQYPHEKRTLPDNYRGMLALLRYDDGTEKCVGCDLCEAACPSRVIRVVSGEVPGEPGVCGAPVDPDPALADELLLDRGVAAPEGRRVGDQHVELVREQLLQQRLVPRLAELDHHVAWPILHDGAK